MTNEDHSVNLGVKQCDEDGTVIDQDYQHLKIKNGTFGEGRKTKVPVEIPISEDDKLCFEILQEGVSWIDDTAKYW